MAVASTKTMIRRWPRMEGRGAALLLGWLTGFGGTHRCFLQHISCFAGGSCCTAVGLAPAHSAHKAADTVRTYIHASAFVCVLLGEIGAACLCACL